jgi:transposase-like protein
MNIDYPETIQEFVDKFKTDQDCYDYLHKLRWPNGFVCPHCKHNKASNHKRYITYRCTKCLKETTITSGTVFHNRHLPIRTWFFAIWFMVSQKSGVSALGLGREIGIKRQKTAWELLKIIRESMSQKGKDKLTGTVEIDEVFIGGIQKGKRGRGADGKVMFLVAVEDMGVAKESKNQKAKIGRVRMQIIPDAKSPTLLKFIQTMVKEGSTVQTDELKSYPILTQNHYKHKPIKKEPLKDSTPLVHRVASLVKRWLLGTHQGGVHLVNMQSYLDEYVFRFNRRTSGSRGKLFYRLTQEMLKPRVKKVKREGSA